MPSKQICPQCGDSLPGHAAAWFCPKCLLGQAVTSASSATETLAAANVPAVFTQVIHYFGDYQLLHEIARGGMGVVYKARQVSLNRTVAVKMLLFGKLAGDDFVKRFHAEAEAAASLQHPNIVAIHEVGVHEGQHYFSMDYLEGTDLAELVRAKPLPPRRAATYLKVIAEAIHYAHQQGILHRDLKPSNILIDSKDQPHITDFGLAKRLTVSAMGAQDSELTTPGQMLGSPHYMSPEQVGGQPGSVTAASDIYSLGAILYQLLTGRPLFLADTLEAVLAQVLDHEPVSLRMLNAWVPRDLETICLKCLNREPSRRYSTSEELAQDLNRWLNDEPIHARPVSQGEKLWHWCRKKPALATLVVSASLMLFTLAIGSSIAAARVNRERAAAEAQATKSAHISQFLTEMLRGIQPAVALGRDTTIFREILDHTEQRLSSGLADLPEVEADLRQTIGMAYDSLDEPGKAEAMYRRSLELRMKSLGEKAPDTLDAMFRLAVSIQTQLRPAESMELMRRTLELQLQVKGESDARTAEIYAMLAASAPSYTESERLIRRSIGILERIGAKDQLAMADMLTSLAQNLQLQERFAEAEKAAREAVAIRVRSADADGPNAAACLNRLASVLRESGKLEEARATIARAIELSRHLFGDTHPIAVRRQLELAFTLLDQNDKATAQPLLRQLVATVLSWPQTKPTGTASDVMAELGFRLTDETRKHWDQGDSAYARECALNAERVLRPLVDAREASAPPTAWVVLWTRSLYAGSLIAVASTDLERTLADRLTLFTQAETELMDVYGKFSIKAFSDPVTAYHNLAPTYERLVALYLRWEDVEPNAERAAKLSQWRQRVDELERNAGRERQARMSERYVPK